jgi:hypothetical protein
VATQLSPKRLTDIFSSTEEFRVPVRVLTAVCILAVLFSLAAVLAGAWDAQLEEDAALQRNADIEALLALPPVDTAALETERDLAKADLADAQAQLEPPSVDPASDTATALLVERATTGGLAVRGVARVPAAEIKNEALTYDVEGIRMTVEGSVNQVLGFLTRLAADEPGLIPSLGSMTVDERNVARAEITFSVYTEVAPTPVPTPPGGPQ